MMQNFWVVPRTRTRWPYYSVVANPASKKKKKVNDLK